MKYQNYQSETDYSNYLICSQNSKPNKFVYQQIEFSQESFHPFLGLCAVDNKKNVAKTMQALQEHGQLCTRMGAFKPRTSPYEFQGEGAKCLSYVFELAGKYGIKIIAMEVLNGEQIDFINKALEQAGNPTGVMLQIGTRNAQNFDLLHKVGSQTEYPVLYKRGFGATVAETINGAEYIAKAGNQKIIICLRGVKSHLADPHRNLADFAQVALLKRITNLPIGIDPSHAVGANILDQNNISDIMHAAASGTIAGANLILTDIHPTPAQALVDKKQAIHINQIGWLLEDLQITRAAYLARVNLAKNINQ